MPQEIATGVVHSVPTDLRKALMADHAALARWEDLTPLVSPSVQGILDRRSKN